MSAYVLKLQCPDQVGIVAKVSALIAEYQGWIVDASQFADEKSQLFFMRVEIRKASVVHLNAFKHALTALAKALQMTWSLIDMSQQKRTVIFAGKQYHCLSDLLSRYISHDLDMNLVAVISNHPQHKVLVEAHGVAFHYVSFDEGDNAAFKQIENILDPLQPDLMILARFMRILPSEWCERYYGRIINIHHSFLPAFTGHNPYERALDAGVKMIGATCHYVTPDLDQGPIIEQDVIRIHHYHTLSQIKQLSHDIEKITLAKGVRYHLEERTMIDQNKTLVFD
jgi:formyltetrahydrofolate deformylase